MVDEKRGVEKYMRVIPMLAFLETGNESSAKDRNIQQYL